MRTLSYIERVVKDELEPHIIRNKERNHKRPLKNTLYDYRERSRTRTVYASGCSSLLILIKAGISYKDATELLNK